MLILGIDTSGKHGSIALAACEHGEACVPIAVAGLTGGTFSAQLVPQIASLLEKHGFRKADVGGFAVVTGPGSFTGLRVGLAAVKGLAEVLKRPIAAVSMLDAVRRRAATSGGILAALDAGRGEVYVGEYEGVRQGGMHKEYLLSREQFFAKPCGRTVVTPDAALALAARDAGISLEQVEYPQSDLIASLGWERMERSETVLPEDLEANYIRRSDAEIFSAKR
jgi:tRNA threonylcarbamoyladenosine biosynthesis protein TsaB